MFFWKKETNISRSIAMLHLLYMLCAFSKQEACSFDNQAWLMDGVDCNKNGIYSWEIEDFFVQICIV